MVFIEILVAASNLDVGFFIDLVMNNLVWVAMFYSVGYFFSDGKAPISRGIIFFLLIVSWVDIFHLAQFTIYTASGIALVYFLRVPLLTLLEVSGYSKYLPIAWILSWYVAITIYVFFVV